MGPKLKKFLIAIGLLSLGLGAYGVYPLLDGNPGARNLLARLLESFYLSLQLFTFNFADFLFYDDAKELQRYTDIGWALQTARFVSPFVTITTAITLIAQRFDEWLKRIRIKLFYRRHVIIYGFNLQAKLFCEDLKRRKMRKVVVVDLELALEDSVWISKQGYIPVKLDGASLTTPKRVKADRASHIFAVHYDDAVNMRVLVRAYQRNLVGSARLTEAEQSRNCTQCYVHFSESIFRRLRSGQQFASIPQFFALRLFSVYELVAKQLAMTIYKAYAVEAINGKPLHLCVFGLSRLGQSVVEQLIRLSYFDKACPTTITIFDKDETCWKRFVEAFPVIETSLSAFAESDRERIRILKRETAFPMVEYRDVSFESAALVTGQALQFQKQADVTRIGIASLSEATRNLAIADSILQQKRNQFTEVFVRSDDADSEVRAHIRSQIENVEGLNLFPPFDDICKLQALEENATERLARAIHREYIQALHVQEKAPNQASQNDWDVLPEMYKESNRQAAAHTEIKCCLLGHGDLDLDREQGIADTAEKLRETLSQRLRNSSLEKLAECEHNRWSAEKLLDNWIPGTERDEYQKRHLDLVPWNLDSLETAEPFADFSPLSEAARQKDRNTIEKIPRLLETIARVRKSSS